jgi:hypothetical protein
MRFKDLNDWLHFVRHANIEQLENIINSDFYLYEFLDNREDIKLKSELIIECQQKLKGTKIEDAFWSDTLGYIDNESLTDEVFNYFYKNNVAITALGHLPLKDEFLWRLAEQVEESILTLGVRYYTDDKYSVEEFRNFLLKFTTYDWLWNTLISTNTNNPNKDKVLKKILFSATDFDNYKQKLIEQSIEKNLKVTKRVNVINKYYRINNPRYLRGVSQNPITPLSILEELINVKNIKYARDIRQFASENIRKRKLDARNRG